MFIRMLLVLVVLLSQGVALADNTKSNHEVSGSFDLHFPEKSVGSISLINDTEKYFNYISSPLDDTLWSRKAVGTVSVPKVSNTIVCLTLNNDVLNDPARIQTIQTKGIQALKFGILSMTDEESDTTNKCLAKIGRFKELQHLYVDSSDASDEALKIVETLPLLRGISIAETRSNGTCFKSFAKLPNLKQVSAQRCTFDESNFKYLAACPKLEKVELRGSNISSKGLKLLSNSKSVKSLFLTKESHIDDSSIALLTKMSQLVFLVVNGNRSITNRSMASISNLKALKEIGFGETSIDDQCIPSLKKLTNLETLALGQTRITEAGLLQLKGLKLKRIYVSDVLFAPGYRQRLSKAIPTLHWLPGMPTDTSKDDIQMLDPGSGVAH